MGPIEVVVEDGNNIVLEVTPTPNTTVILDRGIAGPPGPAGSGDVDGPASSTDNAVARFDGTTGKLIQNSLVTIADDGATVIPANSTTNALRITQTGTGNALLVEDSANPDSTPFVINSGGQVAVGHTSQPFFISGVVPNFAVLGTNNVDCGIGSVRYSNNSDGSFFLFGKSRGTIANQGIALNGDTIGVIGFAASDGTIFTNAAQISAAVDGTPGTNDMPGRLVFSTTADGASNPTERMRIDNAGNVGIQTTTTTNKLEIGGSGNSIMRLLAAGQANGLEIGQLTADGSSKIFAANNNFLAVGTNNTERMRIDSAGNLLVGTTTNTNASRLVVNGTISETVGGVQYQVVSQADIGSAPNEIPLNQYLGNLAYQDASSIAGQVGVQAGTAAAPAITTVGDTNTGMFFPAADTIAFAEGGVEAMRIDSAGNVGIGTSSPSQRLHVNGSSAAVLITGATNTSGMQLGVREDGQDVQILNNGNGGAIRFATNNGSGVAERMRLDASGNLGIGTTSPAQLLDVRSANTSGATGATIRVGSQNNGFPGDEFGNLEFYWGDADSPEVKCKIYAKNVGNVGPGGGGAADLLFATRPGNGALSERARITSNGDFLVGTTTTTYGSIPGRFTSCSPTAGGAGLFYTGFSGDVSTSALNVGKFDNNSTTSQIFMRFGINNANNGSGQINANGAGAAAFGSFSDRRLKENIEPLASQLSSICALNPVEFDYKTGGHQIGFIAQEMQEIYPDTVGEDSNGMLSITGWSKTEARLVKAIQELKAEFDAYKASHP